MSDIFVNIAAESWLVFNQMSPYLLFGFLMAGVLSVCISPEFVERHLGGHGVGPVLKAAALGVPMPLCSCGVIPVSAGFWRHGASRAATISFLLSTPQTGIDNIAIIYGLLGLTFAIFSPIVALTIGLLGGLLVMFFAQSNGDGESGESNPLRCTESCCAGSHQHNVVWRALEYGFVTLPRDIGVALLVGVVIAGAIAALVPDNQWQPYLGGGVLSILMMMALGIPLYVCSSASVPIAAGLIHAGASPGAALAFLIAGPATNAATITTVWKLLGRRTALLYLLTIAISAVGAGLTLDWLMPAVGGSIPPLAEHCHDAMGVGWFSAFWAILLLAVLGFSYAVKSNSHVEGVADDDHLHDHGSASETLELIVDGMTCQHCVGAVVQALRQCSGVASVQVDLATGRAVVRGEQLDAQPLVDAVAASGYQARRLV